MPEQQENQTEVFHLKAPFKPTGDQPQAIEALVQGLKAGDKGQTLLGVTGSGKTFTMANIIAQCNRPTLILEPNKTLASQICTEMRGFFPDDAVEYFVSYYDYYQPEAYIPSTDTYIEKDSAINDEIDRLRHSATAALSERRNVIIVASVSCIYSLGDPIDYRSMVISLRPGMQMERDELCRRLVKLQYERNDMNFIRNKFRVHGDIVDIHLAYNDEYAIRVEFFGDEIDRISEFDPLTGERKNIVRHVAIFPASHYIVGPEKMKEGLAKIQTEMEQQVQAFTAEGKLLEARLKEEKTKTPARYTEATLLSAMEGAGKLLDDEELALAMKEKGLGTPATRAQIIETLIAHKFIERDRRDLVPTPRAESLIKFLNVLSIDSLTSPAMTGEWEQKLRLIERNELSRKDFMKGIDAMTTDIVEKARSFTEDDIENKETDIPNPIDGSNLVETFRAYKSKDGKFTIYKTIGNRKMSEEEIRELVTKGAVGPLDGFRSKLGKPFSATLKLDENFALKFHFGDNPDSGDRKPENLAEAPVVAKCPRSAMGLCSCKDGVLVATDTAYVCRSDSSPDKKCSFRLGKNMLSHVITIAELESLATLGKTPVIDDFVSKRTKKKFSAALALDQKGGISFEFTKKIRKH